MSDLLINNKNRMTICIPTYNRFEKLTNQIEDLLIQLNDSDRIIIIDNATPEKSWDMNNSIFDDPRISVSVNTSNIGLTGNLLKCLDVVQGGWLWLLSDDEKILPNALRTIRHYIQDSEMDFINFKCEMAQDYNDDRICKGIDEYLSEINNDFGNHLLISNNLYKVSSYKNYMKFTYWGCYTNAPHIAPVIMALNHGAKILLSSAQIVSWTAPIKNESWRMIAHFSILYLADLVSSSHSRDKMIKVLIRSLPKLEVLTAQLTYNIISKPEDKSRILDYSNRILEIYSRHGSLGSRAKTKLIRLMLLCPKFYFSCLNILCIIIKKERLINLMQKKKFEFYL